MVGGKYLNLPSGILIAWNMKRRSNAVPESGLASGFGIRWDADDFFPGRASREIDVLTGISPAGLFSEVLPFGEGAYDWMPYIWRSGGLNDEGGGPWDYMVTFEVKAVPLPATAPLLAVGLGIFGLSSRRRSI